ncbi:MAG TPA: hypothetical protein VKB79_11785 [Bryobacteraceae bacterium]|nr:hypothetical protein [Bryobacteraceae bacterium]
MPVRLAALTLLLTAHSAAQTWIPQNSGTKASLRGVSAVNSKIVWASGSRGTWLRTTDAGEHWQAGVVEGAANLDFRGIRAFDANRAILMSSGPGDASRIYQTKDGGAHWRMLFNNPDAKGFFDAVAFWDAKHGIIIGDAVDGRMTVFTTNNGGEFWIRHIPPPAVGDEGAFAASNSCLVLRGSDEAWFGTGGKGAARVFHTSDRGRTWTVMPSPLRNDSASAGIFSLAFRDGKHGVAVGGDYEKDKELTANAALTNDGGKTWTPLRAFPPRGFRSAVEYLPEFKLWIATGTSGSDSSPDGLRWIRFDTGSYNALSGRWAVGAQGRIAYLTQKRSDTTPPQGRE